MSEVYPTDSELIALLSEAETGVEYIPTGTAPYYLHFRRLLYRLLLATKRANDLRVYDGGGLNVGVKAGKFWVGSSLISYAGSDGNTLADNKANIYVYLNASGNLVYSKYTAFPDMAVSKHVRLAVVTTAAGDILAIVDARDHHSIAMPGAAAGQVSTIVDHAADGVLTETETSSVHTNRGATATVTLTLPDNPAVGTYFAFLTQEYQCFNVDPGQAAIRDTSGQTPGKCKWAMSVGESIGLIADANGDWLVMHKSGAWTEEI